MERGSRWKRAVVGTAFVAAAAVVPVIDTSGTAIADDSFAIAYGDVVSDGVPGLGAGRIEPGEIDRYEFTGAVGDEVIVDAISGGAGTFRWRLESPDGAVPFDGLYTDRRVTLTAAGAHTLVVHGATPSTTGTYSFQLVLVPPPEHFPIAIGDTVADGVPAPGAGNLETPGAVDVYTFDGTAGSDLILDHLAGSNVVVGWRLVEPGGAELFATFIGDRQVTLPADGTYTLELRGNAIDGTGTYSFRLLAAPAAQSFDIALGDVVSDGVPGPGAGNIEAPGAVDRYSFEAVAGQTLVFDVVPGSTNFVVWSLSAPDGSVVFDSFFVDQQVVAPQTGTYVLAVRGLHVTSAGTYSFHLRPVAPPSIEPLPDRTDEEGATVSVPLLVDDPDGDQLVITAIGLPPGVELDPASATLAGTIAGGAAAASPYAVEITVSDPAGAIATTGFTWTVSAPTLQPLVVDVTVVPPCPRHDGRGLIGVVVHGNQAVDVARIDVGSVTLAGMPIVTLFGWPVALLVDVDHDGHRDLVAVVHNVGGSIPVGATTVALTASTRDGTPVVGTAEICRPRT